MARGKLGLAPKGQKKSVCVSECVCQSRGVNLRAPGVTKFIAPGNSNHFLSHHALGYWSMCKAELRKDTASRNGAKEYSVF